MKKINVAYMASLMFISSFSFAEPWKDYSVSKEVVEMTVVTVKPNYVDDYLVNLKSTWVDSLEVQKKLGHVIDYGVWTAETAGTRPNVFLTVRYANAAAMEPNKGKYEEFIEAWRKVLSEKEQRNIASGYDDIREIVDYVVLREVSFN
jgi:hypothetical protein